MLELSHEALIVIGTVSATGLMRTEPILRYVPT